jgi:hypothetical protein
MTHNSVEQVSKTERNQGERNQGAGQIARTRPLLYFIVAVLGFSFWYFMVVPFASHRETYWWLGMVQTQPFSRAFSFISTTYRPLAQGATWFGFLVLGPTLLPTSVLRQTLLQGFIYVMFVLAWWQIYAAATQRRLLALFAFVAGLVFFSGYVHLFHIYGIFYIPVMLMLGLILRFDSSRAIDKREVWFAAAAIVLAFWHPFATGLFIGYYFGFYVDTFRERTRAQHIQAVAIILLGMIAIAALVVPVPRSETMPLSTRLFGFLVSYQTNEVNPIATVVAFLLAQAVVFSTDLPSKWKLVASVCLAALSVVLYMNGLPVLFVWLLAALLKLLYLRKWSLLSMTGAAILLPFGGGIGTPIYGLFAIILATYATPLGDSKGEEALARIDTRYVVAAIAACAVLVLLVRAGVSVPILTRAADPLLTERERTYQLEKVIAWLHDSSYCSDEVAYLNDAGSPIDSLESALTRRNRPPSGLPDVQLYWKLVGQCSSAGRPDDRAGTAVLTFGASTLADAKSVFKVEGKYAGDATVWIRNSPR